MKQKRVLKATIWYTFSNFLMKGLGFITTPIFSRILTKNDYGMYTNILAWYAIITIIATFSLASSLQVARFDFKDDVNRYIKSCLILGTIIAAVISSILLLNGNIMGDIMAIEKKYYVIICLNVLVSPAYDMFLQVQRFDYKYERVAAVTISVAVSSILLSFLLIYLMKDDLMARTLGTFMPTFIVSVVLYIYYVTAKGEVEWRFCKYALVISAPYVIHLLSGTILESSDKTVITRIKGAEDNALYSIAYSTGMIVNVLWNSMNSAFSPWLGEKLNDSDFKSIRKHSYGYLLLFSIMVVLISLIAPELMLIMGGKSFCEAKFCLPPILGGYFFWFIYSMYVNIEQYKKKMLPMAIATCFAAVINILTNIFFVDRYGYAAAAYTTWFCYFLLFVFHYIIIRKMNYHTIYDIRFILFVAVIVCIALMINVKVLYRMDLYRYIAGMIYIVAVGIVFWKKRDRCLKYFRA